MAGFLPIRHSQVYLRAKATLSPVKDPLPPIKHGFKLVRSDVTYDPIDSATQSSSPRYSAYNPRRLFPELLDMPQPPTVAELQAAATTKSSGTVAALKNPAQHLFDVDIQVKLQISSPPAPPSVDHSLKATPLLPPPPLAKAQASERPASDIPPPRTNQTAPVEGRSVRQPMIQAAVRQTDNNEEAAPAKVSEPATPSAVAVTAPAELVTRVRPPPPVVDAPAGIAEKSPSQGRPRPKKQQPAQLMHSADVSQLPVTVMRKFRGELRAQRHRPFAEIAPKRSPTGVPPVRKVGIDALVDKMYAASSSRRAMLGRALGKGLPVGRIEPSEFNRAAHEATLPAIRARKYKTGPKSSSLAGVADPSRVARLMDVAQFYRGTKRVIAETTDAVNRQERPEKLKYGNVLYTALEDFADDWEDANLLQQRARLLADIWPNPK